MSGEGGRREIRRRLRFQISGKEKERKFHPHTIDKGQQQQKKKRDPGETFSTLRLKLEGTWLFFSPRELKACVCDL